MTEPTVNETFQWTVHPLRESRVKAAIAIGFPIVVCALIYLLLQSWFWTGLGFLLLFASEFPFFIKTTYLFDQQGVTMKRGGVVIVKKWDQVRSYYPDRNGVQLSPYVKQSWLENYRGMYVQYGKHRDEILRYLENKVAAKPVDKRQESPPTK